MSVVNRIYRRKFPLGNDPWDEVITCGVVSGPPDEIVVKSLHAFSECISCPPEALEAAYEFVTMADSTMDEIDGFRERLDEMAGSNNAS